MKNLIIIILSLISLSAKSQTINEVKSDTLYFLVSYFAQNGNINTYGDMPLMVVDGDYINRKQFVESDEMKKFDNVVIINIIKMSKNEYLTYLKQELITMEKYFYIERSKLTGIEGELFLKGIGEMRDHCHSYRSVKQLLDSEIFRKNNSRLIPIFEKAEKMMRENKVGEIK